MNDVIARIEALPGMGVPEIGGHDLVDRAAVLAILREATGEDGLRAAATRAYDAWRDYFDADERADFWPTLCLLMGRLGTQVKGRDMSEPNDPGEDGLRAALTALLGEVGFMRSCIASGERLTPTDLARQNDAMAKAVSLLAATPEDHR